METPYYSCQSQPSAAGRRGPKGFWDTARGRAIRARQKREALMRAPENKLVARLDHETCLALHLRGRTSEMVEREGKPGGPFIVSRDAAARSSAASPHPHALYVVSLLHRAPQCGHFGGKKCALHRRPCVKVGRTKHLLAERCLHPECAERHSPAYSRMADYRRQDRSAEVLLKLHCKDEVEAIFLERLIKQLCWQKYGWPRQHMEYFEVRNIPGGEASFARFVEEAFHAALSRARRAFLSSAFEQEVSEMLSHASALVDAGRTDLHARRDATQSEAEDASQEVLPRSSLLSTAAGRRAAGRPKKRLSGNVLDVTVSELAESLLSEPRGPRRRQQQLVDDDERYFSWLM